MLGHQLGGLLAAAAQDRGGRVRPAAVAQPHTEVAEHGLPARPLEGGVAVAGLEARLVQRQQLLGPGYHRVVGHRPAGLQVGLVAGRGVPVPGTDLLADVAAEDPVAHLRPELLGDRPLQLDGQVGDAAAGVQLPGAADGVGGAGLDAAGAAPAAIGLEGFVRRQLQGGEQLAQQQPGAQLRVDEDRVLAEPADPGPPGVLPLQDRAVVDVRLHVGLRVQLPDRGRQLVQLLLEGGVVVSAPGVAGDDGGEGVAGGGPGGVVGIPGPPGPGGVAPVVRRRRGPPRPRRRRARVVQGHHDQAPGAREGLLQREPAPDGVLAGHPAHLPVPAPIEPLAEPGLVVGRLGGGDPHPVEAQLPRPLHEPLLRPPGGGRGATGPVARSGAVGSVGAVRAGERQAAAGGHGGEDTRSRPPR